MILTKSGVLSVLLDEALQNFKIMGKEVKFVRSALNDSEYELHRN